MFAHGGMRTVNAAAGTQGCDLDLGYIQKTPYAAEAFPQHAQKAGPAQARVF